MTTRRAFKGVIEGFLGTYTSRYSDYQGYWLFGFLVSDYQYLRIDLLSEQACSAMDTLEAAAITLARAKFYDQVVKNGLSFKSVRAAELEIIRMPGTRKGLQNFFVLVYNYLNRV